MNTPSVLTLDDFSLAVDGDGEGGGAHLETSNNDVVGAAATTSATTGTSTTTEYLTSENARLNAELHRRTVDHGRLLVEHSRLQTEFSRAEAQIMEVLDAVQSLEHPHSNLLALRQRHQQQTADLHSARLELDQCRADLERARAEAADYQRALQATQQEMEFAQRAQREDSARVLSAREAEMARVRDECAAVRRDLEEKEERLGAVERARETQRAAAERDMDALRARVAQLEDALASEKTSTETMKARHVELMQEHQQVQVVAARVDSVVRENTQLHSEAALHQRTIDRMSADNAVLTGRLRELTDGAGHPHHQRQSQSVHDQAVQVDVDAMKWEVFRGQLLRIDQALRVSTRRCAALEQELKRADQEMAVMRERVSGASVDEKQAAIDRLTRELMQLHAKLDKPSSAIKRSTMSVGRVGSPPPTTATALTPKPKRIQQKHAIAARSAPAKTMRPSFLMEGPHDASLQHKHGQRQDSTALSFSTWSDSTEIHFGDVLREQQSPTRTTKYPTAKTTTTTKRSTSRTRATAENNTSFARSVLFDKSVFLKGGNDDDENIATIAMLDDRIEKLAGDMRTVVHDHNPHDMTASLLDDMTDNEENRPPPLAIASPAKRKLPVTTTSADHSSTTATTTTTIVDAINAVINDVIQETGDEGSIMELNRRLDERIEQFLE